MRSSIRITDAIAADRQLKNWSRAKKEVLIRRDFDALRAFAKSKTQTLQFDGASLDKLGMRIGGGAR